MTKKILSKEEILHLAHLARLTLTDEEILKYQEQFGETIDYIKNLGELDTKNVPPTNSVVDLKNVTFEDGVENLIGLTTNEALQNAKKIKGNEFIVDRIMQ
ncbi:Asp-tRNA(Asn)/Glu-tRNA(Gln) amidotransferase subunit GatC [Candidatus Roizmanbacteria bacterium]|nr:Asp-tRNA(Asn)/Glu-tRNA(Gln) amidotransferase subunit GatC [Candidatus Roizmanbacteria bacterium]